MAGELLSSFISHLSLLPNVPKINNEVLREIFRPLASYIKRETKCVSCCTSKLIEQIIKAVPSII